MLPKLIFPWQMAAIQFPNQIRGENGEKGRGRIGQQNLGLKEKEIDQIGNLEMTENGLCNPRKEILAHFLLVM